MPDIADDIKQLRMQGARQIALESLHYLRKFSNSNGFGKKFGHECKRLLAARPTAVVLYNVLKELEKDRTTKKIDALTAELIDADKKIASNGKKIFKKNITVMTHCHSHEVVSLLIAQAKKIRRVYITETRPFYQGRITAMELAGKVPATLIVDSAAGFYMGDVDAVIVGCDALRKDGVVNKIGTLMLAITACEFGRRVYVVGDTLKIDKRKSMKIEMREPREVGKPIKYVDIKNPVFDITPWKYVHSVLNERGIHRTKQFLEMLK